MQCSCRRETVVRCGTVPVQRQRRPPRRSDRPRPAAGGTSGCPPCKPAPHFAKWKIGRRSRRPPRLVPTMWPCPRRMPAPPTCFHERTTGGRFDRSLPEGHISRLCCRATAAWSSRHSPATPRRLRWFPRWRRPPNRESAARRGGTAAGTGSGRRSSSHRRVPLQRQGGAEWVGVDYAPAG